MPIESVTKNITGKGKGKGNEAKSTSPIKVHLTQKNNDPTDISHNVSVNLQEVYTAKETKLLDSSSNKTAISNPPKYTNVSVNNKDKIKPEFSDKQHVNKSIQSKVQTRKYIHLILALLIFFLLIFLLI